MDDREIEKLITTPKRILKPPPKDFRQEVQHLRKDFTLQSTEGNLQFGVFVRRHIDFPENFSIGLIFHPPDDRSMTLFRCNGNHGEVVKEPLRPSSHFDYHKHIITPEDLQKAYGNHHLMRLQKIMPLMKRHYNTLLRKLIS